MFAKDAAMCAKDVAMCGKDAAMCGKDAAMCAKDAVMCAKDAAMCAKDAAMCAKDAAMCAKVLNVRHNDAKTMQKPCGSETWSSFGVAESLPTTAAGLANNCELSLSVIYRHVRPRGML